jgi:hypothetical protein
MTVRTFGRGVYDFLLRFYGPSQLGDYHAPAHPQPVVERPCSLCGQMQSAHVVERSAAINRLRCPSPTSR